MTEKIFSYIRATAILAVVWATYHYWVIPMADLLANHPHPILEALRQYAIQHLHGIIGAIGWLALGTVSTRPKLIPRTLQEWYQWAGDAVQASLPGRFNQPVLPAPPATAGPLGGEVMAIEHGATNMQRASEPKP